MLPETIHLRSHVIVVGIMSTHNNVLGHTNTHATKKAYVVWPIILIGSISIQILSPPALGCHHAFNLLVWPLRILVYQPILLVSGH